MVARCGLRDCDCGYIIEAAQRVWDTIPGEFTGPSVERHSSALVELGRRLGATIIESDEEDKS